MESPFRKLTVVTEDANNNKLKCFKLVVFMFFFSSNIIVCRSLSFQHLSILILWIFSLQVDISSQHLYILALINSIYKITFVNNTKIKI